MSSTQHIDTIEIEYLPPCYINKNIKEDPDFFKKKITNSDASMIELDYDKMKTKKYPPYVIENMRLNFEVSQKLDSIPHTSGERSIEFTLKEFRNKRMFCKIISVIPDGDNHICIIWEGVHV